jgi:hypothetical protein
MFSGDPPFTVTIQKPASLEDRSRLVHAREKSSLLYRLGFSVIVAIPTFIIGVLFMSLISSDNPTKKYLMEPMWIGNASRTQWSLFFLATPVMFYSAGSFHRRSLKEVYALWRRQSRTPVWKRFLRFGSMNLLVRTFPPCSSAGSTTVDVTGIVRSLCGIFFLHRLAGSRSVGITISGWSRR